MDGYKSKGTRRDMLDSMLTYVNKDLLICKLFYFFFFAAFGSLYPLLAIYFKQLGMNATQSGILIGFRPFIEFCSAPFWGGVADKLRKWRQLQLFSLFCWIVFTLAMAFVKPTPFCPADKNATISGHIQPEYSTVSYDSAGVKDAFFALLLIVVIGEFFSAPAITFADSVTLSYLGEDTDNYGRQRMFGSLGWGLSMFFVGMALDHSTTFPSHPCETQHVREKNYIVCFAVFSVLMSCAFITATQFKFPGQEDGKEKGIFDMVVKLNDKVTETITGKKKIDRETLVEEDDEFQFGQPRNTIVATESGAKTNQPKLNENGKPLQITLESKPDMVTDVINSPGAAPSMMAPPDPEEPFLGRWVQVLKLLAQVKFISVLFVSWFMGFGIGLIFTFLFWHLQDLGGSPTLFGIASVVNHISELLAYFLCSRFIATFGHIMVLYAGLAGNIARFMYISWLKDPVWVLPFECLQGLTHAAVWATTCSYVMQAIPLGLRTSAQGILQGLHHGLGRGCGAVFGGIMVYNYGSEVTFRAYGVTCIFVLAGFFGVNYWLKLQGIPIESHVPHATLEEEPQMHFDPHGVPSSLVRELSSSKLNKQEEPVASYGATLGTVSMRSDLEKSFNAPTTETQKQPAFQQPDDDDFNPRASETVNPSDVAFNAHDDTYYSSKREPQRDTVDQNNSTNQKRDSKRSDRDRVDGQNGQNDGYSRMPSSRSSRESHHQNERESREHDTRRDRPKEHRESSHHRNSDESPRRHSMDHSEGRERGGERRERRRRQSGDVEGLREREDQEKQREQREGRRHGEREDLRHREDARGQRRHSKHRRSIEGGEFQDHDPNPREQIVFEKLPDITARAQQPRDPRDDHSRQY